MQFRTIPLACIPLALLSTMLAFAPTTRANSKQVSIVQADRETIASGPDAARSAFDEFAALGVDRVKVQVAWRTISPASKPTDPRSPGAYDWTVYDNFVRLAKERGMIPYLSLGGRAPDWASKKSCPSAIPGSCKPSYARFKDFAIAAGRHFSGPLRVNMWSLWNEPNLAAWISPQRTRKGALLAPAIYRKLFAAGRRGLRFSGHNRDRILLGELAPIGSRQRGVGAKTAPLAFLRVLACVNRRFRPLSRRQARARRCSRTKMRANGFAIHPYTARLTPSRGNKGPRARARRDDATLRNMGRLKRTLDRVRRRLGTRRLGLWITEFGFQSKPPDKFGSSLRRTANYLDESEYISYRSPRTKSVNQYTLHDDPVGTTGSTFKDFEGFQLGLRFASSGPFVTPGSHGKPKPEVYAAYRTPFFVRVKKRRARGRVAIFGGIRGARTSRPHVRVESKLPGGSFRPIRGLTAKRLNRAGYFLANPKLSRATKRRYRLVFPAAGGSVMREKGAVRR